MVHLFINRVRLFNIDPVCGVQISRCIQQKGVRQRKLQLIDFQWLFDAGFQQFYLAGGMVADTEMKNFSLGFQLVKGFCHFFRFHEQIGTVKEQIIQTVCLQAAQTGFYAADDMRFGKVIAGKCTGANAAFALENKFIPHAGYLVQGFPENGFTGAAAVNIRVIPEVDTGFQLFFYEVLQRFCIQIADAHTSLDDGRNVAIADGDLFHMETSFVFRMLLNP